MSDQAPAPEPYMRKARVYMQLLAVMQLLNDAPEGMQRSEILRRIRDLVPPVASELTTNASGGVRYDTNVAWWSLNLVKAGWIVKDDGRWSITDLGRAALAQFPEADALGTEGDRLYNVWRKRTNAEKATRAVWELTDAVIARIPAGRWATFADVTAAVGGTAQNLGVHLWADLPAGWHRVALKGGQLSAEKYGEEDRSDEQRRLLAEDGIDASDELPDDRRLTAGEMAGIVAEVKGGDRAWLVRGTSVKGSSIVPEWVSEGFVSLPASMLPTLPAKADDATIKAAVDSGYSTIGYSQREAKNEEIRAFLLRMKPGDLLLTTAGDDVFVGEIAGEATQADSPGKRSNLRRPADWDNADSPMAVSDLSSRLQGRLSASSDIVELTDVYDEVQALRPPDDEEDEGSVTVTPEPIPDVTLALLDDEAVETLLVGRPWLDELVELLADRHQVIVYGPPGTGKTYLSLAVAEKLAGKGRVTLVQFHPSYSYEDFFEGYRPAGTGDGGVALQLVPGPFRKVVDAARANPAEPYFLIIDEINRANLAKVFGELYFLLEYRDRSIDLLYSSGDTGPTFTMPANVYLIGTMNTADRSIALVDAAMRRRFAFLSLHPEDQKLDRVLRSWLDTRSIPKERTDTLVALLIELNARIADKDVKIGPSYLMTQTVASDAGLDRVWRTSILPLLEEYHVGEGVDVAARYGLPALRKALGLAGVEDAAVDGDASSDESLAPDSATDEAVGAEDDT
jgi:5-methylcytosine-specific restriction protein B